MENNHDKNTQQHSSYFHNGKEYKDIFEAAEAYVQEVLNQGKEDVNTQSPPSQNKTQTALTHPHHKIKKVRSFLCGLLFGALFSYIIMTMFFWGYQTYFVKIPYMLVALGTLYFILKTPKKIDTLLKRLDIGKQLHSFWKKCLVGVIILGSLALATWGEIILTQPVGILLKLPFAIQPLIFLVRIIIIILKKIDALLKKLSIEEHSYVLPVGMTFLGTSMTAIGIELGINNIIDILQPRFQFLFIIGIFQIAIKKIITYWAKFKKMRKKDKIIDIIGFGSIILYLIAFVITSDPRSPFYLE